MKVSEIEMLKQQIAEQNAIIYQLYKRINELQDELKVKVQK
tara:strand:+ start:37 stop:159 length:123 start_codon:yes stop_codon:yes gene_type:complete